MSLADQIGGVPVADPLQLSPWLLLLPAEREQLLLAVEIALATGREDPEAFVLFADLDAPMLERLADRLFAKGAESIREGAAA